MGKTSKLLKKYLPVFLSLVLFLTPVLVSVSEASSSTKSTTTTKSAQSGDYVYYSVYNKIYRINTKTKSKKLIHQKNNWWNFDQIVVYKGYIYTVADTCQGTGETYPYIYRVKTDGTNGKILDKGDNLKLYDGKLYYTKYYFRESDFYETFKNYGIYRMNLDGSSKKSIKSGSTIYDFKIYKSNIYYKTSKNIYRVSTSGKNNTRLISSEEKHMISIYKGNIYYNKYDYNKQQNNVYKYNLSSKKITRVLSNAYGFATSNDCIYYSTTNSSWTKSYIYKKNMSTNKRYLITSKSSIYGAALEGNYILYTSPGPNYNKNTRLSIIRNNGKENTTLADFFVS